MLSVYMTITMIAVIMGIILIVSGAIKLIKTSIEKRKALDLTESNLIDVKSEQYSVNCVLEALNKTKLSIVNSFGNFADLFEKVRNKPAFEKYSKFGIEIPEYNETNFRSLSNGEGGLEECLINREPDLVFKRENKNYKLLTKTFLITFGISSSMLIFTHILYMELVMSSTDTNLLKAVINTSPYVMTFLFMGCVFYILIYVLSSYTAIICPENQTDAERVKAFCDNLREVKNGANKYKELLGKINGFYKEHLERLAVIADDENKCDWNSLTGEERKTVENTSFLAGLLYSLCRISGDSVNGKDNTVTREDFDNLLSNVGNVLIERGFDNIL